VASQSAEVTEIKTVPHVPLSHPFVERLIGTIRSEYLDRTLFWTTADLENKLLDFRLVRRNRGWIPARLHTPCLDVFRRYASQPVGRVIEQINPILRGWVNYFAVGHSSRCFSFVKDWVEKKIRRHLMRARKRKGFGWRRWSRQWLYSELGLFNAYQVRRPEPKAQPAG